VKQEEYYVIDFSNANFNSYYRKQGLMPEEEWSDFLATLGAPLPTSFRVNDMRGFHGDTQSQLRDDIVKKLENIEIKLDGKVIAPPTVIPWYPNGSAWYIALSRPQLKAIPELNEFRSFLIAQYERGHINRQEVVSMIPPLLLDVQPDHYCLDMCAAPGNKTAQMISALHRDDKSFPSTCLFIICLLFYVFFFILLL